MQFCEWLHQHAADELFFHNILWTDEACFTREGVFNVHNSQLWARDNPHAMRERGYQVRFSVSIWAGIVGDIVVGPYLLPDRLTAQRYRDFLETVLPGLLEDVPLAVRQRLWFQHDGRVDANMLRRVLENAARRTAVCLEMDGGRFEQLL
jgi:hypothetical protein